VGRGWGGLGGRGPPAVDHEVDLEGGGEGEEGAGGRDGRAG
jgi:hypothetical protein